jgi:hypothetical protein
VERHAAVPGRSSASGAHALADAAPDLRARIRQDLRRAMYQRIHDAAADRLGD